MCHPQLEKVQERFAPCTDTQNLFKEAFFFFLFYQGSNLITILFPFICILSSI